MNNQNSTIDKFINILMSPVPLLPEMSFIAKKQELPPSLRRRIKQSRIKATQALNSQPAQTNVEILSGKLTPGNGTTFAINGRDFHFDSNTWMFGEVRMGSSATVTVCLSSGNLYAKKIVVG